MTLYSPITVDLYNPYPLKVMNIPQYNTGRGALITLTAAGSVIVPDKETLYIYAKKPDGTMVYASCELSGAQVRASFDEQMTAVAGVLDAEIQMVDAYGNSITTTIFQINIMASNIDYARIVSSDDFIALRDALAMVSGIGDHTQLATENKSSLVAAVNELHKNFLDVNDLYTCLYQNKEVKMYVNEETGSDETGTGSSSKPFKTINKAISLCSEIMHENATIYLSGTYNLSSTIRIKCGKRIQLYLTDDVTINGDQLSDSSSAILVETGGIFGITSAASNKKCLDLVGVCYGLYASGGIITISNITDLNISGLTGAAIYSTNDGRIVISSAVETLRIRSNNTGLYASSNGFLSNSATYTYFDNVEGDTLANYGARATTFGRIYILNITFISSNVKNGLLTETGGFIVYKTATDNFATTPYKTMSGGRIYTGAQTEIGKY